MVPSAADRIAGKSCCHPLVIHVIVDVPLMPAGDSALMAPNVRFPASELVDVELHSLRNARIFHPEIHVISEVVKGRVQSVFSVRETLRRKTANEVVVPEHIAPLIGPAAIAALCRNPAHRWGTDVLCPGPLQQWSRRGARTANPPARRKQCVS